MKKGKNIELRKSDIYLEQCNTIKVTMMVAVILFHSMALWQRGGWFNQSPDCPSKILEYLSGFLSNVHTYCFTFVSGYLFYYLRFETNRYSDTIHAIGRRIKRLLVPYVFASVVWAIPFDIFYLNVSIDVIVKKYIFAVSPSQLWFLVMIFNCFLIFLLFSKVIIKIPSVAGIILGVILYFAAGLLEGKIPNIFQSLSVCRYFIFYYMGILLRITQKRLKNIRNSKWIPLFLMYAILYSIWYIFDGENLNIFIISTAWKLIMQTTGVLSIVFFVFYGNVDFPQPLTHEHLYGRGYYRFLKNYNFGMYLFHQQLIYISIDLLNGKVPALLLCVINFCVAFLGSSLIVWVLSKYHITAKLIGIEKSKERSDDLNGFHL